MIYSEEDSKRVKTHGSPAELHLSKTSVHGPSSRNHLYGLTWNSYSEQSTAEWKKRHQRCKKDPVFCRDPAWNLWLMPVLTNSMGLGPVLWPKWHSMAHLSSTPFFSAENSLVLSLLPAGHRSSSLVLHFCLTKTLMSKHYVVSLSG